MMVMADKKLKVHSLLEVFSLMWGGGPLVAASQCLSKSSRGWTSVLDREQVC